MGRGRGFLTWTLCLGVLLLVYLAGQVNPVGFLLAGVLLPLPLVLAGCRFGGLKALGLALVAVVCLFSLKPGWAFLTQNLGFFELLLMGVLLGGLQYRGVAPNRAIILTVTGLTLATVGFLAGQALIQGVPFQDLLARKSSEVVETLNRLVAQAGDASSMPLPQGMSPSEMEGLLRKLMPSLVIANTGVVAWINVVLARQLAFLLGRREPGPPLFQWSVPEWLIFVVLGAGFLLLVPVTTVRLISLNLLIILALLYFCQGVAVIAAWFQRFQVPRFFRLVGYPLLFLNPVFVLIITLGLMDLWLDFRRLHQPGDA